MDKNSSYPYMKSGTRLLLLPFLLASFAAPTHIAHAQTDAAAAAQPSAPPAMPSDATELMKLAVARNGLNSSDLKPWHIAATYQTFDDAGKPKDKGTFEMWWAAPNKYKISLVSPSFNQTEYRTASGTYFVGEQKWAPYPENLLQQEVVSPLPKFQDLSSLKIDRSEVKDGNLQLQCLRVIPKRSTPSMMDPMYCFGVDIPAIRGISMFDESTIFNQVNSFQGQYIARDIQNTRRRLPLLHIDITKLESSTKDGEIDLDPPKDATPAPARKIMVSAGVIAGRKIAGNPVDYPENAKIMRIQGVVVLAVTIEEDGTVGELDVISGPKELQKAALDSVKSWRYTPYVLNGDAVKVRTQVNVVFTLGR